MSTSVLSPSQFMAQVQGKRLEKANTLADQLRPFTAAVTAKVLNNLPSAVAAKQTKMINQATLDPFSSQGLDTRTGKAVRGMPVEVYVEGEASDQRPLKELCLTRGGVALVLDQLAPQLTKMLSASTPQDTWVLAGVNVEAPTSDNNWFGRVTAYLQPHPTAHLG